MAKKKPTHETPKDRHELHVDGDGVLWFPIEGGAWRRLDAQGRLLCKAKKSTNGELCQAAATAGLLVCRKHGALAPNAKRAARARLAELVDPSVKVLKDIIEADGLNPEDRPKDADRLRAVTIVLDRTGHGPGQTIQINDVKEELYRKLLDAAARASGEEPELPDDDEED